MMEKYWSAVKENDNLSKSCFKQTSKNCFKQTPNFGGLIGENTKSNDKLKK